MRSFVFVCALALVVCSVSAQEAVCTSYSTWTDVAPNQWGSVNNPGTTPLGYRLATLGVENDPAICVRVTNTRAKKVEVMVESVNKDARICVQDANTKPTSPAGGVLKQCAQGRLNACFSADTGRTNLDFYVFCDQSCETSDQGIYYRVRKSEVTWEDDQDSAETNLEMWCNMQNTLESTDYPSSLLSVDDNLDEPSNGIPTFGSTETNAAASFVLSFVSVTITMVATVLALAFA